MNILSLCLCRPGFENDLAAEIAYKTATGGNGSYAKTFNNLGYIEVFSENLEHIDKDLIFARQVIPNARKVENLPENDRILPLLKALDELLPPERVLRFRTPISRYQRGQVLVTIFEKVSASPSQNPS